MRFMLNVSMPHKEFNAAVKDGSAGAKLNKIMEAQKPEAVYFTEFDGVRCAVLIVDIAEASKIPAFAEPWFLTFGASVEFRAVMTPADLAKGGLDGLGKAWG